MTFAIVRAAAWLVRREQRAEWLAEWLAEYCHIAEAAAGQRIAFCLGAIPDALWMRRNYPRGERRRLAILDRPADCLLVLACAAALGVAIGPRWGWLPPGTVSISAPGRTYLRKPTVRFDQYRVLAARPTFSAVAFYRIEQRDGRSVAVGTESLLDMLGVAGPRGGLILNTRRYWQLPQRIDAFLVAKESETPPDARGFVLATVEAEHPEQWLVFAPAPEGEPRRLECLALTRLSAVEGHLLMLAIAALAVGFAAAMLGRRRPAGWTFLGVKSALAVAAVAVASPPPLLLVGYTAALGWAVLDQRRRCPVCLRRLTRPVSIGSASHVLLDWYGAEWMCVAGHGLLYEPDAATTAYSVTRWQRLDASWTALFRGA